MSSNPEYLVIGFSCNRIDGCEQFDLIFSSRYSIEAESGSSEVILSIRPHSKASSAPMGLPEVTIAKAFSIPINLGNL